VPKGKNLLRGDLKLDNQTKNWTSHLLKRQYCESESRKNDRNRRKDPILKPKKRENVKWSSELHQGQLSTTKYELLRTFGDSDGENTQARQNPKPPVREKHCDIRLRAEQSENK
jgi:hypothetical protein